MRTAEYKDKSNITANAAPFLHANISGTVGL